MKNITEFQVNEFYTLKTMTVGTYRSYQVERISNDYPAITIDRGVLDTEEPEVLIQTTAQGGKTPEGMLKVIEQQQAAIVAANIIRVIVEGFHASDAAEAEAEAEAEDVPAEEFKYEMLSRPVSPGAQPKGFVSFDEDEGNNWGTVTYDRQLTNAELAEYEMEPYTQKNEPADFYIYDENDRPLGINPLYR